MPQGRARERLYIPIKVVSRIPQGLQAESSRTTICPVFLEGDDTAFAMEAFDPIFWRCYPQGMVLYCTKRRDPHYGDLIVIQMKSGEWRLRFVHGIENNEFQSFVPDFDKRKLKHERIPFDDIKEVSIVAGTQRMS